MDWGLLAHLGYNMWHDRPGPHPNPYILKSDRLRCDRSMWNDLTARMAEVGMNQIVVDIGEGIRFDSHPELAVEGSWTPGEMSAEVRRLRDLGLTAIPKLNFSATHDTWLNEYSYMVSSKPYYKVCADLIAETLEIFEQPALFHIGMDEETFHNQRELSQITIRQFDLWYHDLNFYAGEVEKGGARAWMWSDRIWHHEEEYLANTPKSILQSNWYYHAEFDFPSGSEVDGDSWATHVRAYEVLEQAGFDQVPTGSNWDCDTNFGDTVNHAERVIAPERLRGFLAAPWHPTLETERDDLLAAVDQVGVEVARRM